MDTLRYLADLFLHVDKHLLALTQQMGAWTNVLLFAVIFMETGLVVTPFLPGDSLLFAAGSLSSIGAFQIVPLVLMLILAALLGDTANYWIGRKFGEQIFAKDRKFLKKAHLVKAQAFYEKHGAKAIVFARFAPIVRTFAPCVAGIAKMNYSTFMMYNLVGGVLWVSLFTLAGYFFGTIPIVQHNFHYVVVGIVLLSIIPIAYEFIQVKKEAKAEHQA